MNTKNASKHYKESNPHKSTLEPLEQFDFKELKDGSGTVLIGNDSIGAYLTVIEALLKNQQNVTVLSRGRYNSLAIDVCNVIQNKNRGKIEKMKTRTAINPFDKKRVSVLEVRLTFLKQLVETI